MRDHAHGKQAEARAFRQLFTLQERAGGAGRDGRWFGVSKFCLPLRRGEDGAPAIDQFEKIELLLSGQSLGIAYVFACVGASIQFKGYALHGLTGGNGLDLARNFETSALELRAELGGDGIGAVLVGLFERVPDGAVHRRRDDSDAEQHRGREQ